MNKHPHEEVILAYYRGEKIEFRPDSISEWKTLSYDYGSYAPSFRHDHQYRIKLATVTVELTTGEAEALWLLAGAVAGCANVTSRGYTNTAGSVLGRHISPDRQRQLVDWAMKNLRGTVSFNGKHK